MDKKGKDIIKEIKHKLQYPIITLQLIADLEASKRKRVPIEFIEDALKALDKVVRLLNKLAARK